MPSVFSPSLPSFTGMNAASLEAPGGDNDSNHRLVLHCFQPVNTAGIKRYGLFRIRTMTDTLSTDRLRFLPFLLECTLRFLSKLIEKYLTNNYIVLKFWVEGLSLSF